MFPFRGVLQTDRGPEVDYQKVLSEIGPLLTPERKERIQTVVQGRTYNLAVVLENIYDRGNASAVMRSQEALGIGLTHMIESGEKFKESQRTTAGADKWVELKKWKSTKDCVTHLKSQGFSVVTTHLGKKSVPIHEIDFTKKTALVLGNEHAGASEEMVELSDQCVILPMTGFVQSYNISVAGALCFYHMYQDRIRRQGHHGDLNDEEKEILKAVYYLRTLDSAHEILSQKR